MSQRGAAVHVEIGVMDLVNAPQQRDAMEQPVIRAADESDATIATNPKVPITR